MRYRFEKTVMVDGQAYPAGAEVDGAEIPAGCLQSLLYVGSVSPVQPAGSSAVAPVQSGPAVDPPEVKTKGKK